MRSELTIWLSLAVSMLAVVALIGGQVLAMAPAPANSTAHVEPGLSTLLTESLSVIVTATDPQMTARAVEGIGGQMTSDLWGTARGAPTTASVLATACAQK